MTVFREIPGYVGYRIGDDGSVWTQREKIGMKWRIGEEWKLMKQCRDSHGYPLVSLMNDGKAFLFNVHTVVLISFVGPRPEGHDCCHRDGNPLNNNLDNLYWGSRKENMRDRALHGKTARGEKTGNSVLTEEMVKEIRKIYKFGVRGSGAQSVAKFFGISKSAVQRVVSGETWKHVV